MPTGEPITKEQQEKSSRVDKMMDNARFMRFLTKYQEGPDQDMGDEEMEKRFETFERCEKVKSDLKEIYAKEIQEKLGLKLTAKDMECMDNKLEEYALNEPEKLQELQNKAIRFKGLPEAISTLESQIRSFGNKDNIKLKLEQARAEASTVNLAKNAIGKFGKLKVWTSMWRWSFTNMLDRWNGLELAAEESKREADTFRSELDAAKAVKAKYGKKTNAADLDMIRQSISEEINETRSSLSSLEDYENRREIAKELFDQTRSELMESLGDFEELTELIKNRADEMLNDLMDKGFEGMSKAQEGLEKLAKGGEEMGFDALDNNGEAFQEAIDKGIRQSITEKVETLVTQSSVKDGSFGKLEKSFASILNMQKIGSMADQETIRQFLIETLEKAKEVLPTDDPANLEFQTNKMKILYLNRLVVKLKNKK